MAAPPETPPAVLSLAASDQHRFRYRKAFERAFMAHLLAYPLAFLTACAAMPLSFHFFQRELEQLSEDLPAVGAYVVRLVAWPAGVVFAIAHLLVLPWVLGPDAMRGRRLFWKSFLALSLLVLITGGASWLWLWLR